MEPNEQQLRQLLEVLRYMLNLQWRARYVEVLPGGEIVLAFEQVTNPNWRCIYTIRQDGRFTQREYYA